MDEALDKYDFMILSFTVMDNHVHLIVRPKKESLSWIMQWINSVFARRFNKLTGSTVHVWSNRFWSKVIDSVEQLMDTVEYIANNAVKARKAKKPEDYRYSSEYFIEKGDFSIVTPYWADKASYE